MAADEDGRALEGISSLHSVISVLDAGHIDPGGLCLSPALSPDQHIIRYSSPFEVSV